MQALLAPFRNLLGGPRPEHVGQGDTGEQPEQSMAFSDPDVIDVLRVQQLLVTASNHRLPIELVDEIVDWAEYWPCITSKLDGQLVARGSTSRQDLLLLRTPPLSSYSAKASGNPGSLSPQLPQPRTKHPVRKIAFTLRSHDQGWSGEPPETHGTYEHSYTWFDARIDRPLSTAPAASDGSLGSTRASIRPEPTADVIKLNPDAATRSLQAQAEALRHVGYATLEPPLFPLEVGLDEEYRLQYNVHAKSDFTDHCIVWSCQDKNTSDSTAKTLEGRGPCTSDGKFVRTLELGDCVSLWARARHPAWQNFVESAEASIYFAV